VSLALSSSNDANSSNNNGTITISSSGTQGANPTPPPTSGGASNGGGGGGGRIDVALLAWLLATVLLQLHRKGTPPRRTSKSIERLRDGRRNMRGRQTPVI
jgi:hypothetical protein